MANANPAANNITLFIEISGTRGTVYRRNKLDAICDEIIIAFSRRFTRYIFSKTRNRSFSIR